MKKMFTVTLAVTISSSLWSMPNLIANGTFEATDGTKYTNGSWAYSNENGGKPTRTAASLRCGVTRPAGVV